MLLASAPLTPWIHCADDGERPWKWTLPQRRNTHWLMVLSLGGSERITVDGSSYAIPAGGTYLIEPGALADLGSERGNRPLWLHFDLVHDRDRARHPHASAYDADLGPRRRWLQPGARALFGHPLPVPVPSTVAGRCRDELPVILARHRHGTLVARHDAAAALWRIVLAWAETAAPAAAPDGDDALDRAAALALARLETMGTDQLARAAGMARSTLAQAWPRRFGCAPGVWLRRQRLARAERLLARPELGLDEIARLCGWADATVFIRAWRAAHGRTPRA
jgi:AraC-like DNA-binding protein